MSRKNTSESNSTQGAVSADADAQASPAQARAASFRTAAQRETVEAFVVAFILALLFRAFLAEAFVIPTGSMAPTLMGAHKDVDCDRCGTPFQVGASLERRGPVTDNAVVAGICPNCRHVNPMDLAGNPNHSTFNGDRILVSKFAYTISDPKRWDVIVFKFPGNPKQNYIKRLVGLPNETLTIDHGDVFTKPTGSEAVREIVRKPAKTLLSMRHLVYDTDYQSAELIKANYPSRWQPWVESATSPPSDSWQIDRTNEGMSASLQTRSADETHWLRYFHRWPSEQQWEMADQGASLADVDPYSSRLITDFYAYDSYVHVRSDQLFDEKPSAIRGGSRLTRMFNSGYSAGTLKPGFQSGSGPEQFNGRAEFGSQGLSRDGIHWVGDLIVEADVETSKDAQALELQIVESGVKYQCQIDLASGIATLSIRDGQDRPFDSDSETPNLHPQAETTVRAGTQHTVRMSNCDDQILLWVDEDLVSFDQPTQFDSRRFLSDENDYPHFAVGDPMDASPVAIGVRGGSGTLRHLRLDRDKYYIATKDSSTGMFDYDMRQVWEVAGRSVTYPDVQAMFGEPESWSELPIWKARRSVTFELQEDQFFPMGDNSPESLDARCWAGTKVRFGMPEEADRWSDASYVPRDLLVGKALLVFWPHSWNSPVPFTPNLRQMKLIR
ncbi:signal peptidase I [Novipirellula artificiosorum]|uniref:Signal peptidase I n=1 Tax=Novipirellula artificiosorum TaxID=2528016 RepID=A0A5C6DGX1_9BACT|nr:signal peptidase I [Novipirellula artificiosorum]TWU35087.1 Signal peptidase I [Novipirellula artificiosorum]